MEQRTSLVDPVPDEPAAIAHLGNERALVIADYHAGIEAALRYEGVEIKTGPDERRERLLSLIDQPNPDRVIFLGDLAHWIGEPMGAELGEITDLLNAVTDRVPGLLVKGNHDGKIEDAIDIAVTPSNGITIEGVGFIHGHALPSKKVLQSDVICVGHEHVMVRLEDEVGGSRIERAWLRGSLDPTGFDIEDDTEQPTGEVIVFPAFNDFVGGTWINIKNRDFLTPFLPEGLGDSNVYLLDGTRLGRYSDL